MPHSRTLGATNVIALDDGTGPYFRPRHEAFPQASAEQWRRADELDPRARTADGEWLLRFRCFAIRTTDGAVTLVDAGIGPVGAPASSWAPVPGLLPAELKAAGIDPDDVTSVVLTHLHTDHIGWAVVGEPYFRNATYLLQRAEHTALDLFGPTLRGQLIEPLESRDQLRLLDGDVALSPAVRVVATPGHTPGHQSVLVEDGDTTVAITGDLLVHAIQLIDPELEYAYETDPGQARASRINLLNQLSGRDALATSHLGEPFGYV
ncbi:MAG TPA: MBL fold metallo-hydrolase [Jatrophihabitantaceae bacterium]|nr:MBL fold metallo-hydrolase [Jatrophihabitantaceae bacterium]